MANEMELQEYLLRQERKKYSYDLVQKLTYFVITTELVFCGYLLLNADKLKSLAGIVWLYSGVGTAALFGLLWRFCYNITNHGAAHGDYSGLFKFAQKYQSHFHDIYAGLSIVTLIWALVAGAIYLSNTIELLKTNSSNNDVVAMCPTLILDKSLSK